MTDDFIKEPPQKLGWKFPKVFWYANGAELFERAAFYGMFIALAVYLTKEVGFTDVEAGWVAAFFSGFLYLFPTLSGAMADKIGFRKALMLAFALLSAGYFLLGAFPTKIMAIVSLALIVWGGSIVKPVISGTVAKSSDDDHRARAFSIFYGVVNVGAFVGKTLAKPLRTGFTIPYTDIQLELGLRYINYYAATMALCALLLVFLFYRDVKVEGAGKTVGDILQGFAKVVTNFRFMALIFIVAGFWIIQGQLYATMPKYMLRLLGEGASPEWLANINPAVVIIFVVPVTHLVRKFRSENAIGIGLFIIPFTALAIAMSPYVEARAGSSIPLFLGLAVHPITLMIAIGIGMQGLAECFLSPKFLEYASKQAPKGEEGLYLGYQHLTTFFAWFVGFIVSGYAIEAYCPDPLTLNPKVHQRWEQGVDTGHRFDLDASLASELRGAAPVSPGVLRAFEDQDVALPGTARLRRAALDGSNAETLFELGTANRYGLAVDSAAGVVYWTDYQAGAIRRSRLDGTQREDLIASGLGCPVGLALDIANDRMYWADAQTAKLQRARLDGSNVEDLLDTDLRVPTAIALDTSAGKIYWVDIGTDKIQRANLDGSNVEDVVKRGLLFAGDLTLDVASGMIYWTDPQAERIKRAKLDGSDVETLADEDLGWPLGIALNTADGKVYWADSETDALVQANLDGSEREEVDVDGLTQPTELFVDRDARALYWIDFTVPDVEVEEAGAQWKLSTVAGAYVIKRGTDSLSVYKEKRALPAEYDHAPRIWYLFAGIGVTAFVAMLVFKTITGVIDRRRAAAGGTAS